MAGSSSAGVYIQSTQVWDVGELKDINVNSQEFKELLVRLYQNLNLMSVSISNKESSYFDTQETAKGQAFFPNTALDSSTTTTPDYRQVFNKTVNFGALPNTATKTVAHGITNVNAGFSFTRIYGCTSDPVALSYLPLPYVDPTALANGILLEVDATNVTITTAADYSAYTTTYVILEYLKS